jgi:hypothetical protein
MARMQDAEIAALLAYSTAVNPDDGGNVLVGAVAGPPM